MANLPDHPQLQGRGRLTAAALGCRAVMANLWEYLDGELERDMTAAIHAHLVACAPCRTHRDAGAALVAAVSWAERDQRASDGLRKRVTARLRDRGILS